MNDNHEDPIARDVHEAQLTAYALGQLKAREREAAESLVARSPQARQFVEETKALATHLQKAHAEDAMPQGSASLRAAVEQRLRDIAEGKVPVAENATPIARRRLARPWLWLVGMAGCLLIAVALISQTVPRAAQNVARSSAPAASSQHSALKVTKKDAIAGAVVARDYRPAESSLLERGEAGRRGLAEKKQDANSEHGGSDGRPADKAHDGYIATKPAPMPGKAGPGMPAVGGGMPGLAPSSPPYAPTPGPGGMLGPGGMGGMGGMPAPASSASQPSASTKISDFYSPSRRSASHSTPRNKAAARDRMSDASGADKSAGDQKNAAGNQGKTELASESALDPTGDTGYQQPGADKGGKTSQKPSPDGEQYTPIEDNSFRSVDKQPLSTFSVDVDTASYANVRRFLNEGRLPPPDAVRIEEMVNYFTYNYSPPSGETPFAVHLETAQCPWQTGHRLLRIGLKGREVERQARGPSNLVFLLDVSGSMGEPDKLPLVKQAMRLLVEQLQEDDRVAIVTYASGTDLRLPSARGNEHERIMAAIDSLEAGGCTYGSAGIELAYQQAFLHFVRGGNNRIILCTDGDLNVGVTDDDELVKLIKRKAKSGVYLTVLGFGTGNLKDGKMEKLADKGHGVYAYIDSLREAHRVLVEQMAGHLVAIAKDVKIQIEFNPAEVAAYRLIGYENRVMRNRDFDNDRKQAGDIGAGHSVTALYELVPAKGEEVGPDEKRPLKYQKVPEKSLTQEAHSGELLTLRLRYKQPEGKESRLLEFAAKDSEARFGQASADFRFASAVAAFGMVLRNSPHRGQATLAAAEEYAAGALSKDPNGHRAEFLDLIHRARKLSADR